MNNLPLNGWNDYRHRSSGVGSSEKNYWFAQYELQETLDKMREDNFNKLPYSTQLQIKLERVRKQLQNGKF